jgi:multidrug efflux pump subunit AcrA (membrane-fusion protein)
MTASVRIDLTKRTVLAIPTRAIRQDAGRNLVDVVAGDGSEVRPVRVGWRDGPWVEITEGLTEGEGVLLSAPAMGGEGPR